MSSNLQILVIFSLAAYATAGILGQVNDQTAAAAPMGVVPTTDCPEGGDASYFRLQIEGCEESPCILKADTNYNVFMNWTQGKETIWNNIRLSDVSTNTEKLLVGDTLLQSYAAGESYNATLSFNMTDVEDTDHTLKLNISHQLNSMEVCRLFQVRYNGAGQLTAVPLGILALLLGIYEHVI